MLKELAKLYGVENLRITLNSHPLRSVGFICYTSSYDPVQPVEYEISEERYKVADGYKIGFKPTTQDGKMYHESAQYQSDLESMINQGSASIRVINLEMIA